MYQNRGLDQKKMADDDYQVDAHLSITQRVLSTIPPDIDEWTRQEQLKEQKIEDQKRELARKGVIKKGELKAFLKDKLHKKVD